MSKPDAVPQDLQYTKEHEWVRDRNDDKEVGITAFAAGQLGDVVFVELPDVGASVTAGEPFGVVESVKSVSDLFSPVSGTITAINSELEEAPERVNEDSYGGGWMIRIEPAGDQNPLLTAEEYQSLIAETPA